MLRLRRCSPVAALARQTWGTPTRASPHSRNCKCANAVARREDIGLELGQRMHVSCYGMLGYALLSSATLGDALRLALQYPALLGTVFSLRLRDDGQRVWFSASEYHDNPALSAFNAEFCLVSLKVICDDLLGRPLPLLEARFEHPRPDYHARYAGAFQCPVVFAAQDNAFASSGAGWIRRCRWLTRSPTKP